MTEVTEAAIEDIAREIASQLGDDLDQAFDSKQEWINARGGDPFRDVNMPFRSDYLDAAKAAKDMVLARIPVVEALMLVRNCIGDLRNGFAKSVDPARWVEQALTTLDKALSAIPIPAPTVEVERALRDLIDHCAECERRLDEELHHVDHCGESLPLTNARAALTTKGAE